MSSDSSRLRPHGGYRQLRSFQVTEIIYDTTVALCTVRTQAVTDA
jgi:hypothetical protein